AVTERAELVATAGARNGGVGVTARVRQAKFGNAVTKSAGRRSQGRESRRPSAKALDRGGGLGGMGFWKVNGEGRCTMHARGGLLAKSSFLEPAPLNKFTRTVYCAGPVACHHVRSFRLCFPST